MNRCLLMNGGCRWSIARIISRHFLFLLFFIALTNIANTASAQASPVQPQTEAYQKSIYERSAKIVNTLGITDSIQYKKIQSIVANEYFALSGIQDQQAAAIADIKKQNTDKEQQAAAIKVAEDKKAANLQALHGVFIKQLNDNLNPEQVEKVKDGITYRVLPITYAAYLDEVPALTAEQKTKIYDWLKEARELAMDEGSSDKKHAVFGKYKGRINNYLSSQGYDMKKEGEEWAKRIQAAKEAKQTQN